MEFREVPIGHFDDRTLKPHVLQVVITSARLPSATNSQPLHYNYASGFSYQNRTATTKDRHILWRVSGSTLTLHEVCLGSSLPRNVLRIVFPALAPLMNMGVSVSEHVSQDTPKSSYICVIATTQANTIHRFVFPHPSSLKGSSSYATSIFSHVHTWMIDSPCVHVAPLSTLRYNTPNVVSIRNQRIFFGCSNGSTICVTLPPVGGALDEQRRNVPLVPVEEVELREATMVQRLMGGLLRAPAAHHGTVHDIVVHNHPLGDSLVFTLAADYKIRVWSCSRRAVIYTEDILVQPWQGARGAVTHNDEGKIRSARMKYVPHPTSQLEFQLVLFLNIESDDNEDDEEQDEDGEDEGTRESEESDVDDDAVGSDDEDAHRRKRRRRSVGGSRGESQFQIMDVVLADDPSQITFDHSYTCFTTHTALKDFGLTKDKIWSLWGTSKGSALRYAPLSDDEMGRAEANELVDVAMCASHSKLSICMPNIKDVSEYFIDKIFEPGLFSLDTLHKALSTVQLDGDRSTDTYEGLRLRMHQAVMSHASRNYKMPSSGNEDEDEGQDLPDEALYEAWSGVWRTCTRYASEDELPMGLLTLHDHNHIGSDDEVDSTCLIIKSGGLSVARRCQPMEMLHLCPALSPSGDSMDNISLLAPTMVDVSVDVVKLLAISKQLSSFLGSSALTHLEEDLWFHHTDTARVQGFVDQMFEDVLANAASNALEDTPLRRFMGEFSSLFDTIRNPLQAVLFVLGQVEGFFVASVAADPLRSVSDFLASPTPALQSQVVAATMSGTFKQLTRTYLEVTRDIALVFAFVSRLAVDPRNQIPTDAGDVRGLIQQRCSALLVWCMLLEWIGKQTVPATLSDSTDQGAAMVVEDTLARIRVSPAVTPLELGMTFPPDTLPILFFQESPLLTSSIRHSPASPRSSTLLDVGNSSPLSRLTNVSHFVSDLLSSIFPHYNVSLFGFFLAKQGLYRQLQTVLHIVGGLTVISGSKVLDAATSEREGEVAISVAMLTPEMSHEQPSLVVAHYLAGLCHLYQGDMEDAKIAFVNAGNRLVTEDAVFEYLVMNTTPETEVLGVDVVLRLMREASKHSAHESPVLAPAYVAELRARYYTKVTSIMEAHRVDPVYTVEFARNAVSQMEECASLNKTNLATLYISDSNRFAIGALYGLAFKYALAVGDYSEAQVAVAANPDAQKKKHCLIRLVSELCEKRQVRDLCALSFGLDTEMVVSVLTDRAQATDVSSSGLWYKALYSFLVANTRYRTAGTAMYRYARRLATEQVLLPGLAPSSGASMLRKGPSDMGGPSSNVSLYISLLTQQHDALAMSLNAFKLVEERHQWIVVSLNPRAHEYGKGTPRPGTDDDADSSGDEAAPNNRQVDQDDSRTFLLDSERTPSVEIVDMSDIERQYALLSSQLMLARSHPHVLVSSGLPLAPTHTDLVCLLMQAGMYDAAFSLAVLFSSQTTRSHTQIHPDLATLFEGLARTCVELYLTGGLASDHDGAPYMEAEWLHTADGDYSARPAAAYWRVLQSLLDKYDTSSSVGQNYMTPSQARSRINEFIQEDRRTGRSSINEDGGWNALVAGTVVPLSVQQDSVSDVPLLNLVLSDSRSQIPVTYNGRAPGMLREGITLVARGTLLPDGSLHASEFLMNVGCGMYRQNVAERIVCIEPPIPLPPWLVASFRGGNENVLLRLYMKYERWDNACVLVRDIIRDASSVVGRSSAPATPMSVCLPYALLTQLLHTLDHTKAPEDARRSTLAGHAATIRAELAQYLRLTESVTHRIVDK
eukprot:TRINITY_DN4459_c0_g1_i5.p1 TRINITY_DN4459_c0_g1~~TRINITY_DN4459_c0_g1_i5.p1  ORF type:complete len:1774 (+),score=465.07 TRINITY_DN4459_c0_g1_i5:59-5380(+)